jgi:hypothetical protein
MRIMGAVFGVGVRRGHFEQTGWRECLFPPLLNDCRELGFKGSQVIRRNSPNLFYPPDLFDLLLCATDTFAISPQLLEHLRKMQGTGLIFQYRNGRPWKGEKVVERKLKPLLKRLGIPHRGLHASGTRTQRLWTVWVFR